MYGQPKQPVCVWAAEEGISGLVNNNLVKSPLSTIVYYDDGVTECVTFEEMSSFWLAVQPCPLLLVFVTSTQRCRMEEFPIL